MRYCVFCGVDIPSEAKYCQICGKEQPEVAAQSEEVPGAKPESLSEDTPKPGLANHKKWLESRANRILVGAGLFLALIGVMTIMLTWVLRN